MTAVYVHATLLGGAVALALCLTAAVLTIAWAAPRAWRDVIPLLRRALVVLLELHRPACHRSTVPMPRIEGAS